MFSKELVRQILRASVNNPKSLDWSIQGFGMLRLYLSTHVRMHVWSPHDHCFVAGDEAGSPLDPSKQVRMHTAGGEAGSPIVLPIQPDVIHDHPWDFTSYVVAGAITNVKYVADPVVCFNNTHTRRTIKCGVGGGELDADAYAINRRLIEIERFTYTTGQSYAQRAAEIHESNPLAGTVTIVARTFSRDTEHAHVFSPLGQPWKSAEPKPATAQEIQEICQLALVHWF